MSDKPDPDPRPLEAAILLEAGSKTIAKLMEEKEALEDRKVTLEAAVISLRQDLDGAIRARDIACFNIVELNDHKALLTAALGDATTMIDHLLGELRYHNVVPRPALMLAHKQFQRKMIKLLSEGKRQ